MRGPGGLEGVLSPQKAEDARSCTPTGDRGWASLSRLEDGTAHSDSLTKWDVRGLYCMRANRSSSRQQAVRRVPSGPGPMGL